MLPECASCYTYTYSYVMASQAVKLSKRGRLICFQKLNGRNALLSPRWLDKTRRLGGPFAMRRPGGHAKPALCVPRSVYRAIDR